MRIMNARIRKGQLKRIGWIIIATIGTIAMVAFTVAPAFQVPVGI
jgi:hypothetical protein